MKPRKQWQPDPESFFPILMLLIVIMLIILAIPY